MHFIGLITSGQAQRGFSRTGLDEHSGLAMRRCNVSGGNSWPVIFSLDRACACSVHMQLSVICPCLVTVAFFVYCTYICSYVHTYLLVPESIVQGTAVILLAVWLLFTVVRPPLIWPWEWFSYPSRSCNGLNGPKGPKYKKQKKRLQLMQENFQPSGFKGNGMISAETGARIFSF